MTLRHVAAVATQLCEDSLGELAKPCKLRRDRAGEGPHLDDDILTDVGEGCYTWSTMDSTDDSWCSSFAKDAAGPLAPLPQDLHADEREDAPAPPRSRFGALARRAAVAKVLPLVEEPASQLTDSLPSEGSIQHSSGQCKPCAWFHKPGGCQNGRDCLHCHLCQEGEHRRRRTAKVAGMRSSQGAGVEEQSEGMPISEQAAPAPIPELALESVDGLAVPVEEQQPQLSVGSAGHGVGECQPCAWFWKPRGCINGAECRRCHLCPEGEIKSRKKTKAANLRTTKQMTGESGEPDHDYALALIGMGHQESLPPPPGLPLPAPERGGEFGLQMEAAVTSTTTASSQDSDAPLREPESSAGAAAHRLGECRPCAWFWKPQGCQNGKECLRCHLCPEGAIKERRRAKKAGKRQDEPSPALQLRSLRLPPPPLAPPPGLLLPATSAGSVLKALSDSGDGLMSPKFLALPSWDL